jgi:predicted RecA/RadA family phage recombinase
MATGVPGNTDEVISMAAPAGGATAGTILFNTTTKSVTLPMTTATSGSTFANKILGRVNTVPKSTAAAWVAGQPLNWVSASSHFKVYTAAGVIHARAVADATAAATTGDVILITPTKGA